MSSEDPPPRPTYPGGIDGVLAQMEGRRDPIGFADGEHLPPLDADLEELAATTVPARSEDPVQAIKPRSANMRKFHDLRTELAGHSELAVLHALLVAHLRKRDQPGHCAALFERLWAEQSDHLLAQLNPRWQVSAITTFGDHGQTPVQRQVGGALSVLFNTMKLYESERRFSGYGSDRPFPLDARKHTPLPLEMDAYSIASGGLDVNMIGRLWQDAESCAVIRPLAHHLLRQLIEDPYTIFRRLRTMRTRMERRKALGAPAPVAPPEPEAPPNIAPVTFVPPRRSGALSWGVVCLSDAPLPDVAAWAAHYIELGAQHLHLYLDGPDAEITETLGSHPAITITTCDAAFWEARGKPRPEAHQLRQAFVATECLRAGGLHFLGHFDVDEFLISPVPVARALGFVPSDMAFARARPAELLCPLAGAPRHYKRSHRQAGQPKSVLDTLYPNFGAYLPGGFISHTTGKVFARTGIPDTRLGIHALKYCGEPATNKTELPRMTLLHHHARDFAHFRARAQFRLDHGSYRKPPDKAEALKLGDILDYLRDNEGDEGLRAFYDEVCTARPDLLRGLEAHDMLLTHDLELDAKVARVFGPLPLRKAGAA